MNKSDVELGASYRDTKTGIEGVATSTAPPTPGRRVVLDDDRAGQMIGPHPTDEAVWFVLVGDEAEEVTVADIPVFGRVTLDIDGAKGAPERRAFYADRLEPV